MSNNKENIQVPSKKLLKLVIRHLNTRNAVVIFDSSYEYTTLFVKNHQFPYCHYCLSGLNINNEKYLITENCNCYEKGYCKKCKETYIVDMNIHSLL